MKMRCLKFTVILGVLVLMAVLAQAGFGPVKAFAADDCKTLLQNRCSSCHVAKYICPRMESNSGSIYWKWVMYTMVKEGAMLTSQEKDKLVDCLSSHDAQARSFCPAKK